MPSPARITSGPSYSGKHRALRRQISCSLDFFTKMDAAAARAGVPWAEWARAHLQLALEKEEGEHARKRK